MGQLVDLILRKVVNAKYYDPRILVVDVHIGKNLIFHTLFDLGVSINIIQGGYG
jgi:hypothetical protein